MKRAGVLSVCLIIMAYCLSGIHTFTFTIVVVLLVLLILIVIVIYPNNRKKRTKRKIVYEDILIISTELEKVVLGNTKYDMQLRTHPDKRIEFIYHFGDQHLMATSTMGRICISHPGFCPETRHCLYTLKLWMFYYALSFVCPSSNIRGLYLLY